MILKRIFARPWFGKLRRSTLTRELLFFLGFLALTVLMTWPWVTHLRDAATDAGDPYLASWVLWWDYHQTFRHPLDLFQANIFYPYPYTLAFSENLYGIAIFCFPLFALGLRPLTVQGIATLLGFAFSGYGAFRLARTLFKSDGAAWVTGIAFAFVPYRFAQLPHLVYLNAGWLPLLLEALVLCLRKPTRRSAAWLGAVFFLNALSSIHWFVLSLLPLALSGIILLIRHGGWRNPSLWRRFVLALVIAAICLLPFLIPYQRAAALYGFVRSPEEAKYYSADLIDWLVATHRNRMWHGLNSGLRSPERELFPGVLPLLLGLAAIFFVKPESPPVIGGRWWRSRILLIALDAAVVMAGILSITISGYGFFKLRVFGHYLLTISNAVPFMLAVPLILIVRFAIAYPEVLRPSWGGSILASLRSDRRSDAFWLAIIWGVIGFLGSLGMKSFFHRTLFDYVGVFRSIRVPARWGMICYVGLALLAGLGAKQLLELLSRHWLKIPYAPLYAVIVLAFLIEQCSTPIDLIHGAVDPDELTLRLKNTPMNGGIVELPSAKDSDNYEYVLRAADHAQPLVTAVSGFTPPIQKEIQSLTQSDPVPDRFIDLLESIPCSYLVVNNGRLQVNARAALGTVLMKASTMGRLRFIRRYGENDLYSVTKTEPNAESEADPPYPN